MKHTVFTFCCPQACPFPYHGPRFGGPCLLRSPWGTRLFFCVCPEARARRPQHQTAGQVVPFICIPAVSRAPGACFPVVHTGGIQALCLPDAGWERSAPARGQLPPPSVEWFTVWGGHGPPPQLRRACPPLPPWTCRENHTNLWCSLIDPWLSLLKGDLLPGGSRRLVS